MTDDLIITDYEGREVKVGTRVRLYDYDPEHPEWGSKDDFYTGTVIGISEWEGDVDDEGRSIGVPPYVSVRFDVGGEQEFITSEWEYESWSSSDPDDPPLPQPVRGKVEELSVHA